MFRKFGARSTQAWPGPKKRKHARTRRAHRYKIGGDDTGWVFLSASQETRHLEDIIFGVDVLRKRGVSENSILIFSDHAAVQTHLSPYGLSKNVHSLADVGQILPQQSFKNVVAVAGGHGSVDGLPHSPPISPHRFFAALTSIQALSVAVVVLCQCYSGVFHFMDATNDGSGPQFVVIGSSSFYPTISFPIELAVPVAREDKSPGLKAWSANIYQLNLFQWLKSPRDIDGDGDVTLLDAYKYAGASTIKVLQQIWIETFDALRGLQERRSQAIASKLPRVIVDAFSVQIAEAVSLLYYIQEPWLLNARLARSIGFV